MKKRLVLALLLVATVCALFTATSFAADHDHTSHDDWTALDQATLEAMIASDGNGYVLPTGKYYLTEDVVLSKLPAWYSIMVKSGNTVSLCLNGHCINASGTTGKAIRGINNSGTLNLMDCSTATTKGYVNSTGLWKKLADGEAVPSDCTAADLIGGAIYNGITQNGGGIYNGGTLNMYGGNIVGNISSAGNNSKGAGICSPSSSVLNIYGGTIAYNVASGTGDRFGAGIFTEGTCTMTGGTVRNNVAASYGGGIYVGNGTFTLKGGTISDNKGKDCGGLYIKSTAAATMTGGTITGNAGTTSTYGSGVEVIGTLNLSGGEIKNNVGAPGFATYNGTVNITGGTVHSALAAGGTGKINITGGTFMTNDGSAVYDVKSLLPFGYKQDATGKVIAGTVDLTAVSFAKGANVKLLGRAQATEEGVRTNFPGDGVEFTATLEGDLGVTFNVGGVGRYRVEIDGELVDFSALVAEKVTLAVDIPQGKHTIRIVQENDIPTVGTVNVITGILINGEASSVAPTAEKDLYIEFIGDSITAGMGTIGDNSTAWAEPTHSGTHSYAYMTAKKMNADYAMIAKGGIGATRVAAVSQGRYVAGELYGAQNVYHDDLVPAVHGKADIVVIGIGTNDTETSPDTPFEAKMRALVKQVRAGNPLADIVLIYNMMSAKHAAFYPALVEELGGAEAGYYCLKLDRLTNGVRSGSATNTPHPSADDNDKNSDKLVAFLKTITKRTPHTHDGWTEFTAETKTLTSGNYYLDSDVTMPAQIVVTAGTKVTICLNGHTLTAASAARHFANYGDLTICDCQNNTTHGYIDAATKLWKPDPTDAKHGTAEEFDLFGGVITGGNTSYGGSIYNQGTAAVHAKLILDNVNFAGNYTMPNSSGAGGGGAINITANVDFTAKNSDFIGNIAEKVAGGAIHSSSINTFVDGGLFYGNEAIDGGAIHVYDSANASKTYTFKNAVFVNNHARAGTHTTTKTNVYRGGALLSYQPTNLDNCTFVNNSAAHYAGGGAYVTNAILTDCTFRGNNLTATTTDAGGGGVGSVGTLTVIRGRYMDNAATKNGGAMYAASTCKITDAHVVENTAGYDGAGLYSKSTTTIQGGNLTGNVATNDGGGVFLLGTATITDTAFANNKAREGGGVRCTGTSNVTLNNVSVTGNTTTASYGGGVHSTGVLVLNSGTISGNKSKSGAGIYSNKTFTMNGGTISDNYATGNAYDVGGGGIYTAGTATLKGGTIKGNIVGASSGTTSSSNARGGGIFVANNGKVTLSDNILITGNKAGMGGAGIYVFYGGSVTMTGGEISGNIGSTSTSVHCGGGGIMLFAETATAAPSFTMTGGTIKGNTAVNGSAIHVHKATAGTNRVSPVLTISGGNVDGAVSVAQAANATTVVEPTITITGGFFTQNVTALLDATAYAWNANSGEVYALGRKAAAVYNGETLVEELTSLTEALTKYAGTGYTVKMLADYVDNATTTYVFKSAKHFVLDMNGYTISAPNGNGFSITADTGVTKIFSSAEEKGELKVKSTAMYFNYGGFEVENLTIICPQSQAISYLDNTGNNIGKNFIKDCVIFTSNWYSLSFNRSNSDMTKELITISGTDFINNSNSPLGCQSSAKGGIVFIGEGNRFFTTASNYKNTLLTVAEGSKTLVKSPVTHSYTVNGTTVSGLNLWSSPQTANTQEAFAALLADEKVHAITLNAEVSLPTLDVDLTGKDLNLNGHTLTVNSLIATAGNITDSTNSSGKLVVGTTADKMNAAFRQNNTQLAVGDANGIWFTDMKALSKMEQKSANVSTYAFNFYLRNPNAEAWLKENPAGMNLGVTMTVSGQANKSFSPDRNLVPGTDIIAYLLNNPANGLKLTVKGLESYSNVSINMWVQINTTAKAAASTKLNPAS